MTSRRAVDRRRQQFSDICRSIGAELDFELNRDGFTVFRSIFQEREYADYFPFYEDAVIVDAGAHYGYFSLFASMNTSPRSRILALEPSPDNFSRLERNIHATNCANIETLPVALAEFSGEVSLFLSRDENHSLFSRDCNPLSNEQGVPVHALSLWDFLSEHDLDRVDFLKMDIEGAEYAVLLNAESSALDRIQTISMEFHDLKSKDASANVLARHLLRHGFQLTKLTYSPTTRNLNYGKLVLTKRFAAA